MPGAGGEVSRGLGVKVGEESGQTVGGDYPEHVRHEEVGERAGDHHEEFCLFVVDAPEFESLEEGLA